MKITKKVDVTVEVDVDTVCNLVSAMNAQDLSRILESIEDAIYKFKNPAPSNYQFYDMRFVVFQSLATVRTALLYMPSIGDATLTFEEISYLKNRLMISAIKSLRGRCPNLSLKEAKDICDKWEADNLPPREEY